MHVYSEVDSKDYISKQVQYVEVGLQLPKKQPKLGKKNFISRRDGLVKVQEQGRDESMQEDYPTTERWQKRKTRIPYQKHGQ